MISYNPQKLRRGDKQRGSVFRLIPVAIGLQYDSASWEVVSASEEPESGCQRPTLFVLYINLKVRRGINKADVGKETDYV
jgi:hypothetical protein